MEVKEQINALRQLMKKRGIDAYIIPSSDAHQSEYVAEHWKCRQWISGFTGSAGTVVITMDDAGLWTDGRYYIQAEKQIKNSGIRLFKMGQPSVPSYVEWLNQVLKQGDCIGFDGRVLSVSSVEDIENTLKMKKVKIKYDEDLIGMLWEDRPSIPKDLIFIHDVKYAGKSREEKIKIVRDKMRNKGANYYLLTLLDDIAWLLNIRGNDVPNNPFVTSYVVVGEDKCYLFIDENKVTEKVREELESSGIVIKDYDKVYDFLSKLEEEKNIILDPSKVSIKLYKSINSNLDKIKCDNITTLLKAVKNDVEIENLKKCYIKDGAAMVKFLMWIKKAVLKDEITELDASNKLEDFRREIDLFVGTSFDTIAGYKEHAAMMHYKPVPEITYNLENEGLILIDSGGQYLNGTTDVTRTIVLGDITEEQKRDFTLVLKAVIGLSKAKFLYGATGSNLDILARKPIWEQGLDYKCGTGHGVGFFSNVHETPQRFSQTPNNVVLEKGMTITNEPGIYKEGKHGIRTENTMLVVEDEKTEFGQFMRFETVSYYPIDLEGIKADMLTQEERSWLNEYHKEVYEKLSPYLNDKEKLWLKEVTREI